MTTPTTDQATTPEQRKYYRSFVRHFGEWEGVDEITAEDSTHVGRSLEFTVEEATRHATQIRAVNGSGQCSAEGLSSITGDNFASVCSIAKACTAKLSYRQDGTVDSEALYDQFGNLLEKVQYTSPSVAEFVDAVFPCDHGRSGIRLVQFERVASGALQGLDEVISFLDVNHRPKPNDAGSYGRQITYDSNKHVTQITNLGPNGENWASTTGYSTMQMTYDGRGWNCHGLFLR
jgi:hypothetical protein